MRNYVILFSTCLLLLFFAGCNMITQKKEKATGEIYNETFIKDIMLKVARWQVAHPDSLNDWQEQWARSVFYSGVMYAYNATQDTTYLNQVLRWGEGWEWKRGPKFRHADDLACGQAYLDAYAIVRREEMLNGIKMSIDSLIADPEPGRVDWWWCDALFMEPPVLVRLGKLTGDEKYYSYLHDMYWDTTDFLYSKPDSLFYRDKNYFNAMTANGKKSFWSRGNAWVLGGLVQILAMMNKKHPDYPKYEELYLQMIHKIAPLQQADGLWRPSLLDPDDIPVKETSGSTFFTYALAWGVNNGLLDKETFLPQVKKGWQGLVESVNHEGKLGYVQLIGAKPEKVERGHNQEYGSGAFLMAASEMLKLEKEEKVK